MSTISYLVNQAKRFTASGRGKSVAPIGSSNSAWARYCINEGHSFRTYTLGFELLTGADCTDQASIWLQRGFAALAAHVGKL
jgi:hypothetical protein